VNEKVRGRNECEVKKKKGRKRGREEEKDGRNEQGEEG